MKYHARAPGGAGPVCGARNRDRFFVVTVGAKEWNAIKPDSRCLKCAEILRKRRTP